MLAATTFWRIVLNTAAKSFEDPRPGKSTLVNVRLPDSENVIATAGQCFRY
jgi:hypothetical protein